MSLSKNSKLRDVAKLPCRELRQNQTHAESILWKELRNRKFQGFKFYRQHPLFYDLLGKETFCIADFYCHELHLVIEVDGSIHKYRYDQDFLRTEIINLLGINVIRINNEGIENNIDVVLKRLNKLLNI